MTETETTERAGAVREVHMENMTYADRRSECGPEGVCSLADVAMALDAADDNDITNHGNSGTGAGAFLEALIIPDGVLPEDYEPDDEDDCERVEGWRHPLFSHLPVGPLALLRQFIRDQARSTCWDGNNHVQAPAHHSQALLEYARSQQ